MHLSELLLFLTTYNILTDAVRKCSSSAGDHLQTRDRERASDVQTVTASLLVSEVLRYSPAIVVYDKIHEFSLTVLNTIIQVNQPLQIYEYRTMYTFLHDHVGWVQESFIQIADLDNTTGQSSLLRHFSTWLIISHDPIPYMDITLDNVVLVTLDEMQKPDFTYIQNVNHSYEFSKLTQNKWTSTKIDVYTLLWMPSGRQWSYIHSYDLLEGSVLSTLFPNTRKGLNGRQLTLVALEWVPNTIRQVVNGEVVYIGTGIDVVHQLARVFNFSYKYVEPVDQMWGHELPDGNRTGVIGVLQRQEAVMSPVTYGITLARKWVMDFSYPISTNDYSAVYIRRTMNTYSWLNLFSGFAWEVYICLLAAILWIISLSLCSLLCQMNAKGELIKPDVLFQTIFQMGLHIPLRQAIFRAPKRTSGRIIVLTWCVFCLMISVVYMGNLIAMATKIKHMDPFTTLQELAENKDYSVGMFDGVYVKELLMRSSDPLQKSLYVKSTQNELAMRDDKNSVDYNIRRFLEQNHVMFASADTINILRNKTCNIHVVFMKERLFPMMKAFVFPSHSPLKKLFNEQLSVMKDNGVIDELERKWRPTPKLCDSPEHVPQLKLVQLRIILVACAGGIVVAAAVLLLETWKKKRM